MIQFMRNTWRTLVAFWLFLCVCWRIARGTVVFLAAVAIIGADAVTHLRSWVIIRHRAYQQLHTQPSESAAVVEEAPAATPATAGTLALPALDRARA